MKVLRQERGWAGHFICANRCLFRRNTLLSFNNIKIVISTVGLMQDINSNSFERIGSDRFYETMAFLSDETDKRYNDINITKEVSFNSPWSLDILDADDIANDMHETIVSEISEGLKSGVIYGN